MNRLWMGALILGSCMAQYVNVLASSHEPLTIASHPDMEQGRDIYRIHCQECHGAEGRGDGPRAALLAPRPGNLVSQLPLLRRMKNFSQFLPKGFLERQWKGGAAGYQRMNNGMSLPMSALS